jgi:hypothetical protein
VDNIARIPVSLNIIKYMSSFPPIWITYAASLGYTHPSLSTVIFYAALINSLYSFLVRAYTLCLVFGCNLVCLLTEL